MNYVLLVLDIVTKISEANANVSEKPGVSSVLDGRGSPMFRGIVKGALTPSELIARTQIV